MQGMLFRANFGRKVEVTEIVNTPLGDGVVAWAGIIQFPKPISQEPETGKHVLKLDDGRSGEIDIKKVNLDAGTASFVGMLDHG